MASFPTGTVGPRFGIFLSPLNTNDEFYLSHMGKNSGNLDLGCKNKDFFYLYMSIHIDTLSMELPIM